MPTLFLDPQFAAESFRFKYKKNISKDFISCMDIQLTKSFEMLTGLKINKQISIAFTSDRDFFVESGPTSKMTFNIYVNHNWNPILVLWKSASGRVYNLDDTDINCDDIRFWFEHLDVALIHKQMFPGDQLPFKLKNLTYELLVSRISIDCSFELTLKNEHAAETENVIETVDSYFAKFNERSEKKKRKPGLIHHYHAKAVGNKIIYDIDLGSAGPIVFKDLLPYLSSLNYFTKIEIG